MGPADKTNADDPPPNLANRNQFGIKSMLMATAGVALICFIYTLPPWVAGLALLGVIALSFPFALSLAIYGRRHIQAFGIGALVPLSIMCFGIAENRFIVRDLLYFDDREAQMYYCICLVATIASGCVAQATRWWCLRNQH